MQVLNINGKEVKLRFGMHVVEMLSKNYFDGIGTIKFTSMLVYYAHENYCEAFGEIPLLSKSEVFMWIEDNYNNLVVAQELKKVVEAYNESKPAEQIKSVAESATKKKQQTGRK